MKVRMQKTSAQANDCPQRDRSATKRYEGVQTFMWICEDNFAEVPFDKAHLLELILSPDNLNRAYKAVVGNKAVAVLTRCRVSNCYRGSWPTRMS